MFSNTDCDKKEKKKKKKDEEKPEMVPFGQYVSRSNYHLKHNSWISRIRCGSMTVFSL